MGVRFPGHWVMGDLDKITGCFRAEVSGHRLIVDLGRGCLALPPSSKEGATQATTREEHNGSPDTPV